jgi:hypothetical protein
MPLRTHARPTMPLRRLVNTSPTSPATGQWSPQPRIRPPKPAGTGSPVYSSQTPPRLAGAGTEDCLTQLGRAQTVAVTISAAPTSAPRRRGLHPAHIGFALRIGGEYPREAGRHRHIRHVYRRNRRRLVDLARLTHHRTTCRSHRIRRRRPALHHRLHRPRRRAEYRRQPQASRRRCRIRGKGSGRSAV